MSKDSSRMNVIPPLYSKHSPFLARVKEKFLLGKAGSTKKTYHITLDIEGSGITYEPGDAIGVMPSNQESLVDAILKEGNLPHSLKDHLLTKVNLDRVTTKFLDAVGISFATKEERSAYLASTNLLSALGDATHLPEEAFELLPPLLPRFYSIASSQKVSKNSIDLVVATFVHTSKGLTKPGVASDFLCTCEYAPIFLHPSKFRPVNSPMIMIGPGTGIAPFRAFLQHVPGKHWLFFGERNRESDFYYKEFFLSLPDLKLNVAFSRDQEEKQYVQHEMLREGAELWQWIEAGAHIFICGDAKHMAKDVTQALHDIIELHGKQDGKAYIKELRKSGRLLLDVY